LYDHIVRTSSTCRKNSAFMPLPTFIEKTSSKSNCFVIHGGQTYLYDHIVRTTTECRTTAQESQNITLRHQITVPIKKLNDRKMTRNL